MSTSGYRYSAHSCGFLKSKAVAPGNFSRKSFPTRQVAVMGAWQNAEQNMPNHSLHVGAAGRSKVCDNKTLCTIGAKHYSQNRSLAKSRQAGLAERELLPEFQNEEFLMVEEGILEGFARDFLLGRHISPAGRWRCNNRQLECRGAHWGVPFGICILNVPKTA